MICQKSLTYILKISCRFLFLKCQIKVLDKKTDVVYDIHCAKYLSRSDAMEWIVKKALLYDFYGELLTEHQKSIYGDYILNDIGISEIAVERGISRQGVHEQVKRCDKILEEYEEKLHLVEKFLKAKELVAQINKLAGDFGVTGNVSLVNQIQEVSNHILEEF